MSRPNLPGADRSVQWFGDTYPGSPIDGNCVVLHTTETSTPPGYGGGASAPHLTVIPDCKRKRLDKRQHLRMDRSARALQNDSGGVETNTLNCIQIELQGCCSPEIERIWRSWGLKRNRDYIFWPKAPRWARRELGRLLAQLHRRYGVKLDGPPNGQWRQTGSWGESAPQRFTFGQWRRFYGICGHQHVPENDHWDPGGLNFESVLGYAERFAGKATKANAPEPEDAPKTRDPNPPKRKRKPEPERRRPIASVRAKTGYGNRVDTGRSFIAWARNIAKRKGNRRRAERLDDWLDEGPKGTKK